MAELNALRGEVRQLRARLTQNATVSAREALLVEAERIAHLGSWVWDLSTQQIVWSDEFFRILGLDPAIDTATPEGFFAAIHPDDRAKVDELTRKSFESGTVEKIECRVVRSDGDVRDLLMDGAFLFDEQGRIRRMVGCALDVTDPKRSKQDVRRSQAMLEIMEQLTGVGVFHWSGGGKEDIYWSQGMYRIFGVPQPLSSAQFVESILQEDRPAVVSFWERLQGGDVGGPVPFRVRRQGEVRHLIMNAKILSPQGTVGGSVVDITERIEGENRLRQSQKMEALGRLAGGVAHDFNNLLTVIMGNTNMILEEDEGNPWARELLSASEQAAALTRQLLSFSRDSVIEATTLNLNEITEGALTLIRRMVGESVKIHFHPDPNLWPILADAGQINQVLMNLAVNARDALPEGGEIIVTTKNVPHGSPGLLGQDCVLLRVTDNGRGMSEAERSRAFDPFFTTKSPDKGTGLGLATVFAIVTQHGGIVSMNSELGKGTEFSIHWPRVRSPVEASAAKKERINGRNVGELRTIVVVEDEEAVRRIVTRCLEANGFEIHVAATASEARELVDGSVDLLLTDIALPDGNGTRLARELRERWPALRVAYMSGHAAETGGELDAPLLAKPFSNKELLHYVHGLFGRT